MCTYLCSSCPINKTLKQVLVNGDQFLVLEDWCTLQCSVFIQFHTRISLSANHNINMCVCVVAGKKPGYLVQDHKYFKTKTDVRNDLEGGQ